jgi:hypothetical protein
MGWRRRAWWALGKITGGPPACHGITVRVGPVAAGPPRAAEGVEQAALVGVRDQFLLAVLGLDQVQVGMREHRVPP